MFEETRLAFKDALNKSIGRVHDDYVEELKHFGEVANTLGDAINGIDTNVKELHAEFDGNLKTQMEHWDGIYRGMSEVLESMNKINRLSLEEQSQTNRAALNEQTDILKNFIASFKSMLDGMQKFQGSSLGQLNTSLNELGGLSKSLQQSNVNLQSSNAQVLGEVNALLNQSGAQLATGQTQIVTEIKKTMAFLNQILIAQSMGIDLRPDLERRARIAVALRHGVDHSEIHSRKSTHADDGSTLRASNIREVLLQFGGAEYGKRVGAAGYGETRLKDEVNRLTVASNCASCGAAMSKHNLLFR